MRDTPISGSGRPSPLTLVFAAEESKLVAHGLNNFQALEDEPFSFALPESAFEKCQIHFRLNGQEPVADDLVYSASLTDGADLPSWLKFDSSNHIFSGTPGHTHVGVLSVVVTVEDQAGSVVSSRFMLSIAGTGADTGRVEDSSSDNVL